MAVLGVDVGGTTVKARVTGDDGAVLAQWRESTPTGDPQALAGLVGRATEWHPVDAVVLSCRASSTNARRSACRS